MLWSCKICFLLQLTYEVHVRWDAALLMLIVMHGTHNQTSPYTYTGTHEKITWSLVDWAYQECASCTCCTCKLCCCLTQRLSNCMKSWSPWSDVLCLDSGQLLQHHCALYPSKTCSTYAAVTPAFMSAPNGQYAPQLTPLHPSPSAPLLRGRPSALLKLNKFACSCLETHAMHLILSSYCGDQSSFQMAHHV